MATSTIKLTEDLEHFNLVFTERGEAVDIAFNPRDTDMILRIEKSQENIGKALDEIPDGENNTEVLEKVNTAIRGEIDYISARPSAIRCSSSAVLSRSTARASPSPSGFSQRSHRTSHRALTRQTRQAPRALPSIRRSTQRNELRTADKR